MNVIIAVIDTLRYDYIGANGNDWIRTPNLDGLASQSWCFDRCFSSSFPTIPHRLDALTARPGNPFHAWMPLPYHWATLPEALAEAGYATQLIHDTPHLVNGGHHFDWPFHGWTFVRGAEVDRPWVGGEPRWPANWAHGPLFDFAGQDFQFSPQLASYARANRGRNGREDWNAARLFRTAARFAHESQWREDRLLWVDCFDPHEPWDAPPEFIRAYDPRPGCEGRIDPRSFQVRNHDELPEEAREHVAAQYAAKVSWMDHCLGTFLDALEHTGLLDHSALILTADHGTRVGDWGRFGKGGRMQEQIARVPMFVRPPGGEHGRSDAIVQPQDIWATVAGLTGIDVPGNCDSQDMLAVARRAAPGRREVALAGRSADSWGGDPGRPLLSVFGPEFYLELAPDPAHSLLHRYGEFTDCSEDHPGVADELREAGIAELERRGTHPDLLDWLRGGGQAELADDLPRFRGWPKPEGYRPYFQRLYPGD